MIKFGPRPVSSAAILAGLSNQNVGANSFTGNAGGYLGLSSRFFLRGPSDGEMALRNAAETLSVSLAVEANNVLAQRGGTSAQSFRLYNTYTDALNYERGHFAWSSNILELGSAAAGTGTNRTLRLNGSGTVIDLTTNDVQVYRNGTSSGTIFGVYSTGLTSTALLHTRLAPSINQASGTYTVLDINPTETSIGAGPHYLIRGRIGAGGDVFGVKNDGAIMSGAVGNGVQFKNNGGTEAVFTRADGTTGILVKSLNFRSTGGTLSALGSAPGAGAGAFAYVSDLTSTTRGATATGGGSLKGFVWSDGTNWIVF